MEGSQAPRDYWMCGHPQGCEEEPRWAPLTGPRPFCKLHNRAYERYSDIADRARARADQMGRRGGGPSQPRRTR